MIQVIYVEEAVREHPRTLRVLERFPKAQRVPCERYGEIFNRRNQSFRLQKSRPSLILARKHQGHVLPAPEEYGIGGMKNFYFAHMLNCPYDCRYCFLQGMYRSASYVLFVNFEELEEAIEGELRACNDQEIWFFSGYDCDSLAFEGVTGFAESFVAWFESRPRAHLELRTKSTQIGVLLGREPVPNVVVAYSLNPAPVANALEHGAPTLDRRLSALARLQERGWRIGLRFDPLIHYEGFLDGYRRLFSTVFERLSLEGMHSVSLGAFRLPRPFHRRMTRLYPDEPLFAQPFEERDGMVSYRRDRSIELFEGCRELLLEHIPETLYFPCLS